MDDKEQTYTVFAKCGSYEPNTYDKYAGLDLAGFIDAVVTEFSWFTPVAWTHGLLGYRTVSDLREESIAAGRVIKQVDGKWTAFGPGAVELTATLDRPAPTPKVKAALDLLEQGFKAQNEPKRAPLDWNKPTEFNNFPGYQSRTINPNWSAPDSGKFADRRRDSAQVAAVFGSAHLLD